jgi:transposase
MDLTDEQWAVIEPHIPKARRRTDGKGRPLKPAREVLNGILWILRTGAAWQDMPDRYPAYQTCHRRFQSWVRSGVLENILRAMADDLKERGKLDLSECYIDGTFIGAKKGGGVSEIPSGAKVRRSWQWQTILAFLSPFTLKVLRHMKSDLLNRYSKKVLWMLSQSV